MGLDVRLPLGFMFVILGVLLVGYGMLAVDMPGASMNVGWGLVLLIVGALMLWLTTHSEKRPRSRR
jgi:protein-S-isoprenylcysteine O-methyltransferase Ste14